MLSSSILYGVTFFVPEYQSMWNLFRDAVYQRTKTVGSGPETGEYKQYTLWKESPSSIDKTKELQHTTKITLPTNTLKETSLFIPIEHLVTLKHKGEEDKVDLANSFSVYQARESLYGETLPVLFEKEFFNDYELPMRVSTGGRWIGRKRWFDTPFYTSLLKTKNKIQFSKLVDSLKTRYDHDALKETILRYQKRCKKIWKGSHMQGKVPSSLQLYNEKHS